MRSRGSEYWMMCIALAACGGAPSAPAQPPLMATADRPRPSVAPELAVPDTAKLVLVAHAKGVQIYACSPGDAGAAWKLHAPRADLLDDSGVTLGQHYGGVDRGKDPGPWWEAKDGSTVHGTNPVSVPNPGSIPLLRLDGSGAELGGNGGLLSYVSFIQRLDTTGGVAPTGACTAGQRAEVPYTATYYFYTGT